MDNLQIKQAAKSIDTKVLNDAEMKKQDGEFVSLGVGITHYQVKGDGKAVVLVHGYATPYYIYDKLLMLLSKTDIECLDTTC